MEDTRTLVITQREKGVLMDFSMSTEEGWFIYICRVVEDLRRFLRGGDATAPI